MQPAPPGRPFRRRMAGTLAQVAPIWNGSWRQLTTLMLVCGPPLVGTRVLYPASHWMNLRPRCLLRIPGPSEEGGGVVARR